jgi:hypothetical protein
MHTVVLHQVTSNRLGCSAASQLVRCEPSEDPSSFNKHHVRLVENKTSKARDFFARETVGVRTCCMP